MAAILAADVVGYTRLMGDDERATINAINACRDIFRTAIEENAGRVVDMAGDSVLAVFDTAIGAATAALAAQKGVANFNAELPESRRMRYRIGLNSGDIHEQDDGTVYGDGVNVAARVESLAEAGGISVSAKFHDEIEARLAVTFADQGNHEVKNVARPVRVYRVLGKGERAKRPLPIRKLAVALGAAVLAVAAAIGLWLSLDRQAPAEASHWPVVAVSPFTATSGNDQDQQLADSLSDAIGTALSKFTRLVVVPHKEGDETDYVIEGRIHHAEDSLRVAAQLLEQADGSQLWAEAYDRSLALRSDFSLQDEIVAQIAGTLANDLGPLWMAELQTFVRKPLADYNAFDGYLLTVTYFHNFAPTEHAEAMECLEAVVERVPDGHFPWLDSAWLIFQEHAYGHNPRPEPLERALAAAQRAKALNPNDYNVYWILAKIQHARQVRLDGFHALAEQAIDLNPYNTEMLADLGTWMAYAGEWQRGRELIERTMSVDPSHGSWMYFPLFLDLYRQGNYREALVEAQKINLPQNHMIQGGLAAVYGKVGDNDNAVAAYERAVSAHPGFAEDPREPYRNRRMAGDLIEALMDGLRKAGIAVPPPPG